MSAISRTIFGFIVVSNRQFRTNFVHNQVGIPECQGDSGFAANLRSLKIYCLRDWEVPAFRLKPHFLFHAVVSKLINIQHASDNLLLVPISFYKLLTGSNLLWYRPPG